MVRHLHKQYVRGTQRKAIVQLVQISLCHLTSAVAKGINASCNKVYVNTRVIKHVYDKRPAEEFDFLTEHLVTIVKYPTHIYKNKDGKRGSYCFVKEINNQVYLCSIETIVKDDQNICEVVTFFRTNNDYLRNYELLWEWEGGIPPS